MRKLILIALIIFGLGFLLVKYVDNAVESPNIGTPKQEVHKVLQHDGGEGISLNKAVQQNDAFTGLLSDTFGHTPDKSVKKEVSNQIKETIDSFNNSVKPNQLLPKVN